MSCFDAFLDSMYGPETPRKRTISHLDNSAATPDQTPSPVSHHKRARYSSYLPQALPYILTESEMSLANFQKELNDEREREREWAHRRTMARNESSSRSDEGAALRKALELLMSPPISTPAAMSDCRSSPSSSISSTPSPLMSRRSIRHYTRPAGPLTDPTRAVPVLQLTEPDEIPEWLQLLKIFEEKEATINYDLLLVPGTELPEVPAQPSLSVHLPEEDDSDNLSELEALIESYF